MSDNHEDAAVHKKSKRQKDLVVQDEASPARERKKSKKSKVQLEDTSAGLAEAIHQEQLKGAEEGERKEKKEKKKRKDKAEAEGRETQEKANHDVPTVDLSTKDESLISVKKSKKKIDAPAEATEELAPSSSSTGEKRKRKEVAKESDRVTETETPKKKNKSTDKAPESTTPAKIEGVEAKTAKRPKRSKKEIEASALDEQREKGLSYVRTYATSQKDSAVTWKFNKATQNWLMRNVFNPDAILEDELEMVLTYLKTMQGRSREGLISQCQAVITPSQDENKAEATPAVAETEQATPLKSAMKKKKAPPPNPVDVAKIGVKVERAKRLLESFE